MLKSVKIYCLYEPHTCKIRYIGRTISPLNTRLTQHLCKSRKNYSNCHKENWIRGLLKNGIKPKIRLLTTFNGTWEDSHKFEKDLIQRHLKKHNLVNGDDKGPGKLAKNINPVNEAKRIAKIKEFFSNDDNKTNFYNKIHCYDIQGNYVKEYKSRKFAVEELDVKPNSITDQMIRAKKGFNVRPIKGYYFASDKFDFYPYKRKI